MVATRRGTATRSTRSANEDDAASEAPVALRPVSKTRSNKAPSKGTKSEPAARRAPKKAATTRGGAKRKATAEPEAAEEEEQDKEVQNESGDASVVEPQLEDEQTQPETEEPKTRRTKRGKAGDVEVDEQVKEAPKRAVRGRGKKNVVTEASEHAVEEEVEQAPQTGTLLGESATITEEDAMSNIEEAGQDHPKPAPAPKTRRGSRRQAPAVENEAIPEVKEAAPKRSARGKGKRQAEPEPEPDADAELGAEVAEKPAKATRGRGKKKMESSEVPERSDAVGPDSDTEVAGQLKLQEAVQEKPAKPRGRGRRKMEEKADESKADSDTEIVATLPRAKEEPTRSTRGRGRKKAEVLVVDEPTEDDGPVESAPELSKLEPPAKATRGGRGKKKTDVSNVTEPSDSIAESSVVLTEDVIESSSSKTVKDKPVKVTRSRGKKADPLIEQAMEETAVVPETEATEVQARPPRGRGKKKVTEAPAPIALAEVAESEAPQSEPVARSRQGKQALKDTAPAQAGAKADPVKRATRRGKTEEEDGPLPNQEEVTTRAKTTRRGKKNQEEEIPHPEPDSDDTPNIEDNAKEEAPQGAPAVSEEPSNKDNEANQDEPIGEVHSSVDSEQTQEIRSESEPAEVVTTPVGEADVNQEIDKQPSALPQRDNARSQEERSYNDSNMQGQETSPIGELAEAIDEGNADEQGAQLQPPPENDIIELQEDINMEDIAEEVAKEVAEDIAEQVAEDAEVAEESIAKAIEDVQKSVVTAEIVEEAVVPDEEEQTEPTEPTSVLSHAHSGQDFDMENEPDEQVQTTDKSTDSTDEAQTNEPTPLEETSALEPDVQQVSLLEEDRLATPSPSKQVPTQGPLASEIPTPAKASSTPIQGPVHTPEAPKSAPHVRDSVIKDIRYTLATPHQRRQSPASESALKDIRHTLATPRNRPETERSDSALKDIRHTLATPRQRNEGSESAIKDIRHTLASPRKRNEGSESAIKDVRHIMATPKPSVSEKAPKSFTTPALEDAQRLFSTPLASEEDETGDDHDEAPSVEGEDEDTENAESEAVEDETEAESCLEAEADFDFDVDADVDADVEGEMIPASAGEQSTERVVENSFELRAMSDADADAEGDEDDDMLVGAMLGIMPSPALVDSSNGIEHEYSPSQLTSTSLADPENEITAPLSQSGLHTDDLDDAISQDDSALMPTPTKARAQDKGLQTPIDNSNSGVVSTLLATPIQVESISVAPSIQANDGNEPILEPVGDLLETPAQPQTTFSDEEEEDEEDDDDIEGFSGNASPNDATRSIQPTPKRKQRPESPRSENQNKRQRVAFAEETPAQHQPRASIRATATTGPASAPPRHQSDVPWTVNKSTSTPTRPATMPPRSPSHRLAVPPGPTPARIRRELPSSSPASPSTSHRLPNGSLLRSSPPTIPSSPLADEDDSTQDTLGGAILFTSQGPPPAPRTATPNRGNLFRFQQTGKPKRKIAAMRKPNIWLGKKAIAPSTLLAATEPQFDTTIPSSSRTPVQQAKRARTQLGTSGGEKTPKFAPLPAEISPAPSPTGPAATTNKRKRNLSSMQGIARTPRPQEKQMAPDHTATTTKEDTESVPATPIGKYLENQNAPDSISRRMFGRRTSWDLASTENQRHILAIQQRWRYKSLLRATVILQRAFRTARKSWVKAGKQTVTDNDKDPNLDETAMNTQGIAKIDSDYADAIVETYEDSSFNSAEIFSPVKLNPGFTRPFSPRFSMGAASMLDDLFSPAKPATRLGMASPIMPSSSSPMVERHMTLGTDTVTESEVEDAELSAVQLDSVITEKSEILKQAEDRIQDGEIEETSSLLSFSDDDAEFGESFSTYEAEMQIRREASVLGDGDVPAEMGVEQQDSAMQGEEVVEDMDDGVSEASNSFEALPGEINDSPSRQLETELGAAGSDADGDFEVDDRDSSPFEEIPGSSNPTQPPVTHNAAPVFPSPKPLDIAPPPSSSFSLPPIVSEAVSPEEAARLITDAPSSQSSLGVPSSQAEEAPKSSSFSSLGRNLKSKISKLPQFLSRSPTKLAAAKSALPVPKSVPKSAGDAKKMTPALRSSSRIPPPPTAAAASPPQINAGRTPRPRAARRAAPAPKVKTPRLRLAPAPAGQPHIGKLTQENTTRNKVLNHPFDRVVVRREIKRPPSPNAKELTARAKREARQRRELKEEGRGEYAPGDKLGSPVPQTRIRWAIPDSEDEEEREERMPRHRERVPGERRLRVGDKLDEFGNFVERVGGKKEGDVDAAAAPGNDGGKSPVTVVKYLYKGEEDTA